MKKIIVVLVCLSFFVNCPGSDEKKKKEKENQNLLIGLVLLSATSSTCNSTNSVTPTSTDKAVPFSSVSGSYYSIIPVTVTVGQKVTFTSTTSNARTIVGSSVFTGNMCTSSSVGTLSSTAFTRDSGTSTTLVVYTAATAGTWTFFPLTTTSQPTDIKVKVE